MAGTRTPKVDRAVKDFRDLGLALRGVVTQFKMITAPLQGMVQAFQRLSAVYDLSKSTGASMDSLKKYGAVLKSLGGDVKDAASVFGKLDQAVTDMNMGKDSALLNDLAFHFGLTFTGDEKPDEYMDKIRAAMATMSPEMQRALQKTLGMSDAMFHAATLPAKEYAELVAKNNAMRLSSDDEKEATKNSLALRSALGRLSTAWDSLQLQLGNVFAKLIPLIDGLASLIAWIAKSKVAVSILAAVIGLLVVTKLVRFIRGLWNLAKAFKAVSASSGGVAKALFSVGQSAGKSRGIIGSLKSLWQWSKRIGSIRIPNPFKAIARGWKAIKSFDYAAKFKSMWTWAKELGPNIMKGLRTAKTTIGGWLSSLGSMFGRGATSIGNAFRSLPSKIFNGIKGIKNLPQLAWNAVKALPRILMNGIKGMGSGAFNLLKAGGIKGAKILGGSVLSALMFAYDGVTFFFKQIKKYGEGFIDNLCMFFTETRRQMFSSFGDFFAIFGGLWSGFWEGLGDGLADAVEMLVNFFTLGFLPDNWLSNIRNFFGDFFGAIMGFIAHPFDSIASAFEAACGGIKKAWTATRRWLPSWLGGYSDEEKKRLDEEEEKEKAAEKAKEREENAVIAQKQIESFTPQQKVDYDFSQFGATTNGVDLRNISVPTVNLPQMPTLPAPALPDAGKLYDATNLLQLPELPSPDKFQDAFSALETAGSNLRTVNLAAAGASSMVQTTNDNRSAFNTTSTNTSVKVDGITINAQTDSPDKLGQAVMNTLNNYTNYGLDASTSVAGL